MLARHWKRRKKQYDFVVIGSGYGGAVTAARLATADLHPKPSVCILERGREWVIRKFPDTLARVTDELRSESHPLGLYELLNYPDVSVFKGCGLGGTSLINANVAATPDPEVFDLPGWPRSITLDSLRPYIERFKKTLGVQPDPRAWSFKKVQAMDRRAREMGMHATPMELAVNFAPNHFNRHGVFQRPCLGCGDCTTGCNHHSKKTLYMNYLPMAKNAGAHIFTQHKVSWIEKLPDGGWRIRGTRYSPGGIGSSFKLDAGNIILSAGSVNTTEILLRSQQKGLPLSPALGTRFSTNGDFLGVSYNGNFRTQVTGFGNHPESPIAADPPGPAIVSGIHYNSDLPLQRRIQVEDFTIPRAYVQAAKAAFALLRGEDSDTGDESQEHERICRDRSIIKRYQPDGALNHSMFYLVMAFDDSRGKMVWETPWHQREGRVKIVWDEAGRQQIYTRINAELRRHARAQGGSFVANPAWAVMDLRHLVTTHPLGGCPMGEEASEGAVDGFGRVFAGEGEVHEGLFVADGSMVSSCLGVNPFVTIGALAERVAEFKIRELQGQDYPKSKAIVSPVSHDPLEVFDWPEDALLRLFGQSPGLETELLVPEGEPEFDVARRTIGSGNVWTGFLPADHSLNEFSCDLFAGFKKEFRLEEGRFLGISADSDGRVHSRHSLEEVSLKERTRDLEPGRYLLLRYLDSPWQRFYELLRIVRPDLIVGRAYQGEYPHGEPLFAFAMTRTYGFRQMTPDDHDRLFQRGSQPNPDLLEGNWRLDLLSLGNRTGPAAMLRFTRPDQESMDCRFRPLGQFEQLLIPDSFERHLQRDDARAVFAELRSLDPDFLVGRFEPDLPATLASNHPLRALALIHPGEAGERILYTLTRQNGSASVDGSLGDPFLNARLPDGLGMTFNEELEGWFLAAPVDPADVTPGERPSSAVDCRLSMRLEVTDLNEFLEGYAHEARVRGTLAFGKFEDAENAVLPLDGRSSHYVYRRSSTEAKMWYQLHFISASGKRLVLEGVRVAPERPIVISQIVFPSYGELSGRIFEKGEATTEAGMVLLHPGRKVEPVLDSGQPEYLRSLHVTGTDDPLYQLHGKMRFLAFTLRAPMAEI